MSKISRRTFLKRAAAVIGAATCAGVPKVLAKPVTGLTPTAVPGKDCLILPNVAAPLPSIDFKKLAAVQPLDVPLRANWSAEAGDFLYRAHGMDLENELVEYLGEQIRHDTLHVDVFIKPIRPVEHIQLQTIITPTGASFEDIVAGGVTCPS